MLGLPDVSLLILFIEKASGAPVHGLQRPGGILRDDPGFQVADPIWDLASRKQPGEYLRGRPAQVFHPAVYRAEPGEGLFAEITVVVPHHPDILGDPRVEGVQAVHRDVGEQVVGGQDRVEGFLPEQALDPAGKSLEVLGRGLQYGGFEPLPGKLGNPFPIRLFLDPGR